MISDRSTLTQVVESPTYPLSRDNAGGPSYALERDAMTPDAVDKLPKHVSRAEILLKWEFTTPVSQIIELILRRTLEGWQTGPTSSTYDQAQRTRPTQPPHRRPRALFDLHGYTSLAKCRLLYLPSTPSLLRVVCLLSSSKRALEMVTE